MTNSARIVNLPPTPKMVAAKRMGPKSPNLAEAYEFFTGTKLEGAHNAWVDIMAAKTVYYALKSHNAAALAA
jgi:DNA polymerase-3 subunit epsilon